MNGLGGADGVGVGEEGRDGTGDSVVAEVGAEQHSKLMLRNQMYH